MKYVEVTDEGVRIRQVGNAFWDTGIVTLAMFSGRDVDNDGIFLTHDELADAVYKVVHTMIYSSVKKAEASGGSGGYVKALMRNNGYYYNNKINDLVKNIDSEEKKFIEKYLGVSDRKRYREVEKVLDERVFKNDKVIENLKKLVDEFKDHNKVSDVGFIKGYLTVLAGFYANFPGDKFCVVTGEKVQTNIEAHNNNLVFGRRPYVKSQSFNGYPFYVSPIAMSMHFLTLSLLIKVDVRRYFNHTDQIVYALIDSIDVVDLNDILNNNSAMFPFMIDYDSENMPVPDLISNVSSIFDGTYRLVFFFSSNQNGNGVFTITVPSEYSDAIRRLKSNSIDPNVFIMKMMFEQSSSVVSIAYRSNVRPEHVPEILYEVYKDRGVKRDALLNVFNTVYNVLSNGQDISKIHNLMDVVYYTIRGISDFNTAVKFLRDYNDVPKRELYVFVKKYVLGSHKNKGKEGKRSKKKGGRKK